MIDEIEQKDLEWKSAECKELRIQYIDWDNKQRTYTADFLIDNKFLVECKPKKLMSSSTNKCKFKAAIEFCRNNNLEFVVVDPNIISEETIFALYTSGDILFLPRYKEKFEERLRDKQNA